MKVVYPICCGGDVHKTFLVATIISSQRITPHFKKEILQFQQFHSPIQAVAD